MTVDTKLDLLDYAELVPTFEHSEAYLRKLLTDDFADVKVEWTVERDEGDRPTLGLRLTDYVGSVSSRLPVKELNDWYRVEGWLIYRQRELLAQRSKYHRGRIDKMLAELTED